MKRTLFLLAIIILVAAGCGREKNYEVTHRFPDKTWYRFNILQFELPVKKNPAPLNIVFFTRYNKEFPYDSLAFNMDMTAPSGEERIRECRIRIRDKKGNFLGTFQGDSCEVTYVLRKEMVIDRDGILKISLENLVPRMRTPGLYMAGIRLEKP